MKSSKYLHIGITGHRDLLVKDQEIIKEKLKELFNSFRKDSGLNLKLFSALAPGADILAAECLEPRDKLVIIQVLTEAVNKAFTFYGNEVGYEPTQENNESTANFEQRLNLYTEKQNKHAALYERYLFLRERPNSEIDSFVPENELDYTNEHVRNQRYIAIAKHINLNCTHLIALWDGVDGGGVGGTSDVVRMWLKGKGMDGTTIAQPNKKRALHHLICPRDTNYFPIQRFKNHEQQL